MSKRVFVKFVSDPEHDMQKIYVGIACALQAISDGHEVDVFFAGMGVRILHPKFVQKMDNASKLSTSGPPPALFPKPMFTPMINALCEGANLYCSSGSVKYVFGNSEGDEALFVADDKITWSGPSGVIALATASDVQLVY